MEAVISSILNLEKGLTLERRTVVAIATHLWKLPDIAQQIDNFLDNYAGFGKRYARFSYIREMSREIRKNVFQKLNHQHLPEVLKVKIKNDISEIGERIFNWLKYLIENLHLDFEFVKTICLTSGGIIDENETFECMQLNYFDTKKHFTNEWFKLKENQKLKLIYYLACLFAQEDFIVEHQADILKNIRSIFDGLDISRHANVVFSIMSIVIFYYNCHRVDYLRDKLERGETNLVAGEMLEVCKSLQLYKAFVFFWRHMNATQQLGLSVKNIFSVYCEYETENLFQMAIFLINEIDDSQKNDFIFHNFNFIFFKFLKKESFQHFCLPVLKFVPQYIQNVGYTKYNFERSLLHIIYDFEGKIEMDRSYHLTLQLLIENIKILKLFIENSPEDKKFGKKFLRCYDLLIKNIFDCFCIPALNLIINDKDVEDSRWELICLGRSKFKDLIQNNKIRLLEKFMGEVLKSENERNEFKKKFHFLEEWFENGHTVQMVLNWLRTLHDHEKLDILNSRLDLILSYGHYIKPTSYGSIPTLLKWYFEIEGEPLINHCKDKSVLQEFCREIIFKTWFESKYTNIRDKSRIIKFCTDVLTCIFGSNKEADFKKMEVVKDERCVRLFCKNFLNNKNPRLFETPFFVMDQFFKFCALPLNKIDEVKKSIADNASDWINEFGISFEQCDVIVVPLLNWVFGNETESREVLKNHFNIPN